MDFGLRDWLLILGPLFIVVVLLHGYWKMRSSRNDLKMSLDKRYTSSAGEDGDNPDDLDLLKAELPSGGARVIKQPAQQDFDLDEDVPVLMEPVNMEDPQAEATPPNPDQGEIENHMDTSDQRRTSGEDRPEKILVINVLARDNKFNGQKLLETLVDLDMTFGEMDIFHRLDEFGEPCFSLANAVEPGTFHLATMDELVTPGVILFMKAHEREDPVSDYNNMLEVANRLAEELGGELRDETRSVLTPQTIEHCRQDIRDYKLKYA
ncbi:MAG: cell division protein ZipA [Pseudomonadales bacterium]